jgi:hypothetical protein
VSGLDQAPAHRPAHAAEANEPNFHFRPSDRVLFRERECPSPARQATIISYDNMFKLLVILTPIALPLVLLIGSSRATKIPGPAEVHALD